MFSPLAAGPADQQVPLRVRRPRAPGLARTDSPFLSSGVLNRGPTSAAGKGSQRDRSPVEARRWRSSRSPWGAAGRARDLRADRCVVGSHQLEDNVAALAAGPLSSPRSSARSTASPWTAASTSGPSRAAASGRAGRAPRGAPPPSRGGRPGARPRRPSPTRPSRTAASARSRRPCRSLGGRPRTTVTTLPRPLRSRETRTMPSPAPLGSGRAGSSRRRSPPSVE